MRLSAILVNYHSLEPLLGSLPALAADARDLEHEVVVVDNSRGDGTRSAIAERFPWVRWIENDDNLGFARGVNRGLESTRGDFALLLNPDCQLRPGALAALLAHMETHPRCAIAGPRIEYPDGRMQYSARSYPGVMSLLFNRYSLLTRLFPNNRWSRRYLLSDWDHHSERDVDWLSGACLLARRAAIDQVGAMDPAFFMFNEDVDWCHRMNDAGWKVTFVPAAGAIHQIGASRHRVASKVIVERHLGMIHYHRKHHRPGPLAAALVWVVVMARAGVMLIQNRFQPR